MNYLCHWWEWWLKQKPVLLTLYVFISHRSFICFHIPYVDMVCDYCIRRHLYSSLGYGKGHLYEQALEFRWKSNSQIWRYDGHPVGKKVPDTAVSVANHIRWFNRRKSSVRMLPTSADERRVSWCVFHCWVPNVWPINTSKCALPVPPRAESKVLVNERRHCICIYIISWGLVPPQIMRKRALFFWIQGLFSYTE